MPVPADFKLVSDALLGALPHDAVIVGLEVSSDSSYVTVWTTTPAVVIGRQGRVADALRDRLSDVVGAPVKFQIEEAAEAGKGTEQGAHSKIGIARLFRRTTDPVPPPRIPRSPANDDDPMSVGSGSG